MAQSPRKTNNHAAPPQGDPLFNLKHAQAEAELVQNTQGMGPITNQYVSTDEDTELDEGPRDSQGLRRGEPTPTDAGSTAGRH
jgi:hypothetical protein